MAGRQGYGFALQSEGVKKRKLPLLISSLLTPVTSAVFLAEAGHRGRRSVHP